MWIKYGIGTILFLLLAIMQASFVPHMSIGGVIPNLVFIAFVIFIFSLQGHRSVLAITATIGAGLLLDAFSPFYFGVSLAALLLVYGLDMIIVYFLRERQEKYLYLSFLVLFSLYFVVYTMAVTLLTNHYQVVLLSDRILLISLIYNLAIALPTCYCYYRWYRAKQQLKLF